ncbi:MAG: DEAD/DEAH box helicase, partial [Bacteroidota bacterium]
DFKTESNYLAILERLNIRVGDDNLFRPFSTVAAPPIDIPLWFIRQKSTLVEAGFLVEDIRIGDKSIVSNLPKISFAQTGGLDWLDIHGMVTVGKFTFKFLKLANYIRTSDPFFPLPDGTYFIIPQEWMTRYKGLIQFGTLKDERLRIHKSQYGVLQGLAVDGLDTEQFIEKVVYQPSKLLKAKLRPYQLEGVQWLVNHHQNNYGALLADDMGLGKTLQTIALLLYASEQKTAEATTEEVTAADLFHTIEHRVPLQALIILPTSLIYNWENEIRKFAPALLTYQHVGAKRHKDLKLLRRFDVLLTTYQTALRDVELLRQVRWEYVILDESQYIKNKNSKIFKAISQIESEHRLSLSGTPIENSLSDLWAQMHFINPKLIGSFTNFKREFITPIEKQDNKEKVGFLRDLVAPFLLRRTKQMVAKDLPELTEQIFYSTMTGEQKKMYEEAKSAARNFLLEEVDSRAFNYQSIVLQTLNKLRQIVNHPVLVQPDFTGTSAKFDDVLAQLGKLERGAHKTLMFSSFLRYLNLFQTEFEQQKTPYALLNGQLTRKQRQHHIDKFMQNKEVRHFLISLKAGATGLNLTAADYVLLLDPWYNPFAENQAIARAHRIGQLRQVISLKFITKDTIEEKILALQQRKAQLAADIIGTSKLRYSKEDLSFLLQ